MSTTFKTLYQKVLLRVKNLDGRALLTAKESVNDAIKYIARVQDFDELKVLDTSQVTVASQKNYILGTDWVLTRYKDIISIRLMDASNSRKLQYKTPSEVDSDYPYVEDLGEQKCSYYTQRGNTIELIPIPDAVYTLYIYHTQWPLVLSADADVMSLPDDLDDVVIGLASEMANYILMQRATDTYEAKTRVDWTSRAKALLTGAVSEEVNRPDRKFVAQPFDPGMTVYTGEYWKQPFVKKVI